MLARIDPHVDRYIIGHAGELKILEAPKHWMAYVPAVLRLIIGVDLLIRARLVHSPAMYWILMWLGWVLIIEACWRHLLIHRDRFVVTTARIFRTTGVVRTKRAPIGLERVPSMTMSRPTLGQWLGYGHLHYRRGRSSKTVVHIKYLRDIDHVEDVLRITAKGENPAKILNGFEGV